MSIADLLPAVRSILPLNNVDALNRLARTLCDVLELAVSPPVPAPDAVAVPALTPQEFLFSTLLDGPRPAKIIERMAREQHGWPPRLLFKARQEMRVKAIRCGFGRGGRWLWALPEGATDRAIYFRPDEWRNWIAGHRANAHHPNLDASS
jgi:hypothetical protein